jgi:hypothetical protein
MIYNIFNIIILYKMPKTRKQNMRGRRHRKGTKRGGAPLPTSYSTKLKQFLLSNYKTDLKTIEMYEKAGISFTDARRYLGKRVPDFTRAQMDSLQQNGWSQDYINEFNASVPYELMLAYGSENHDDPNARSSPPDSDQETVVYKFEKPTDKFMFSEEQIERLIDLGIDHHMRISMFEKEINKGNMKVDDLFKAIEKGDYDRPPNSESSSESFQPVPSTTSLEQEPNNRSLHLSDLVVNRSSSINSSNSPLYTPESADDESSNGRLRVSDLIDEESEESLYTPDSGSKSSRNGGKRKRRTMRKRGKKRKSMKNRKRS